MKTKLKKIMIIGAGKIAAEYLKVLNKNNRTKIVGILSRTITNSKKLAHKFGILNYGNSIDLMMKKLNPDLVIVCVSTSETFKVCKKLFKYECVSLIEKPIALSVKECITLNKLSSKHKHRFFVALNRRFFSSTKILQKKLSKINDKRVVTVFDQENTINAKRSGHSVKVINNWMFANSIHLIDYFNIFCRGNYTSIKKEKFSLGYNQSVLICRILYDSGDIGVYHAYWNRPAPWKVTVSCEENFYTLSPLETLIEKNNKGQQILYKQDDIDKKFKPGFFSMINEFINAYYKKKNRLVTIDENLKTMKLIDNIYKNAKFK